MADVVTVAGGVAYIAPVGTTGPTGMDTPLNSAFKTLGVWAEDGSTVTPVPGDEVTINDHTGAPRLQRTKTGNVTFEFPFIELNPTTFETFWDTELQPDGSYEIVGGSANREYALVYDQVFSNGTVNRRYMPRVRISDRGAQSSSESDALTHSITFSTLLADGQTKQIIGFTDAFEDAS